LFNSFEDFWWSIKQILKQKTMAEAEATGKPDGMFGWDSH
jgi:hypothetical protein